MPISPKEKKKFEEAKKKWLAKIGNKSWEELANERDAKLEAASKKIMTPEYLEMWAEGEKELDQAEKKITEDKLRKSVKK